jgi:hypothetical protein
MGHCISVYLIKKEDLRDEKLSEVLDGKKQTKIVWTELKEGILATPFIPDIREFGKDKTTALISTDYFGGPGYQEAKLFVNNKKVYDKSSESDYKLNPINDILKLMGIIKKEGMDEFDTIGLGKYRSNRDFNHQEVEIGEL